MEIVDIIQTNLLSPLILFFILGLIAVRLKSDLKIPENITTIISLYLLMAIGLHGGLEIKKAGIENIIIPILVSIGICVLMTLNHYAILRRFRFNVFDSSAIAATYGSVSVGTFSVGVSYFNSQGIVTEGYLAAILAILESIGLIVGIFLANIALIKANKEKGKKLEKYKSDKDKVVLDKYGDLMISDALEEHEQGIGPLSSSKTSMRNIISETLTGKAILVLLGSITIGYIIGDEGFTSIKIVFEDAFRGALVIYLLEMGIIAGQRLQDIKKVGVYLVIFAILIPQINAIIGVVIANMLGLSMAGSVIFGLILGSASYIAAPAALRNAIPKANPSLYITASLGITFPYNVIINLPILVSLSTMIQDSTFISNFMIWGNK